MMARGQCDISMNHFFTLLVANWTKTAITIPKYMIFAHCVAAPDVLCSRPVHGDSVNIFRLYKEAEITEENLERHYSVANQGDGDNEYNWTELV